MPVGLLPERRSAATLQPAWQGAEALKQMVELQNSPMAPFSAASGQLAKASTTRLPCWPSCMLVFKRHLAPNGASDGVAAPAHEGK